MILPQLEHGAHGAEVVGMICFDDNTLLLRRGDPLGERVAPVAHAQGILLLMCDACALERGLAEEGIWSEQCRPKDTVEGVQVGGFPDRSAAFAQNPPDQVVTLPCSGLPSLCLPYPCHCAIHGLEECNQRRRLSSLRCRERRQHHAFHDIIRYLSEEREMVSTPVQTPWRIVGEEVGGCNCAWGCPCQFNALPTHGRCEGLAGYQIHAGSFGTTPLDGVRFAHLFWWPGPIHEGNGTRQLLIDAHTTPEQRAALLALESGTHGGVLFEIMAAVCPTVLEPLVAPIILHVNRELRQALLRIPGIAACRMEPIKNPVTGAEHRARIVLPDGFEFTEAEMANTVSLQVEAGDPLQFHHTDTYGQLNAFNWGPV